VAVAAGGVGLPHLDQRVRHGPAVTVEHPPGDLNPLADRLPVVLAREVVVERAEAALPEHGPGHLGEHLRQQHERILRMAELRAAVALVVEGRVNLRVLATVRRKHQISHPA
jgi:hypothetical protein